jgi:hypothetical protein
VVLEFASPWTGHKDHPGQGDNKTATTVTITHNNNYNNNNNYINNSNKNQAPTDPHQNSLILRYSRIFSDILGYSRRWCLIRTTMIIIVTTIIILMKREENETKINKVKTGKLFPNFF